MIQIVNNKIQQRFSASAKTYDQFSALHREIADRLLERVIKEPVPSALLDVGCGTGYLTVKFRDHFPQSRIIGVDFAQGMLEVAHSKEKKITWILADGNNLPFSDACFDLLISNLAYQWVPDLVKVFFEAKRVLTNKGLLACTLFGYNSCQELFQCLDKAQSGQLKFSRLPSEDQVKQALVQNGFNDPKIDCQKVRIEFKDMRALIVWLKTIGANNLSLSGYLGRGVITRASKIYLEEFPYLQGVGATFEIIQVYAKK